MTAISTFLVEGWPVLLGDLLVSGIEKPNSEMSIPTIDKVTNFFPEGSGWTITGLSQKVTLISEDCAVAWAGSWLGAKVATVELREIAKRGPLTRQAIDQFLSTLDSSLGKLDVSLLGFLKDGPSFYQFAYRPDLEFKGSDGSLARASGSGATTVQNILTKSGNPKRVWDSGNKVHPAQLAFEHGVLIGGSLLRGEKPTGYSLRRYFGGGYEVATHNGERFTKGGGLMYILWDGREPDSKGFAQPSQLITYRYAGDTLLMLSQKLNVTNTRQFTFGKTNVHYISPIFGESIRPNSFSPHDFSPETFGNEDPPWICHCFMLGHKRNVRALPIVERRPTSEPLISFVRQKGMVTGIQTRAKFWTMVYDAIRSAPESGWSSEDETDRWWLIQGLDP